MTLDICEKRRQVLETEGHILVTGGPGSGKTTIALLKALRRIEAGLENEQEILFLSFSNAAVARIVEAAKKEKISKEHYRLLNIKTFHSFFWQVLRTHGYLLGAPKLLSLLPPHDERALSDGIERDDPAWPLWEIERERLFREEGRVAFDLFAPKAAELFGYSQIRRLFANRYPLIIVDEAQDTGPDQWLCIRALAEYSQILCLADLEQQIFDFLPGIGPERIQQIETDLHPTCINLGNENNRSPDKEIVAFGNNILTGISRQGPYRGVSQLNFHPRADRRDKAIRQSIGIISEIVKKETGKPPESIALFASFDRGATIISNALRNGTTVIQHKVLFDEAPTLLASRFVAFLLEPKHIQEHSSDLAQALDLLGLVFRAKGTARARVRSQQLSLWARQTKEGKNSTKSSLYKKMDSILGQLQTTRFVGDPKKDWNLVRRMLRDSSDPELAEIDNDLNYLMTFNRGRRIESGLSSLWEEHGEYLFARQVLDTALAEDQIISGCEDLSGIHVMTMHKSKGKQFDAVIIFRAEYISPFVWPRDPPPFHKSRKVLRVAITRARLHVLILNQVFPKCPILSDHTL